MKPDPGDGRKLTTVLVSMPFVSILHPSIQLGLLAQVGRARGHDVETLHLHCDLAAAIGTDLYESLCRHRGCQVGDWLFSADAFRAEAPDPDGQLLAEFPEAIAQLLEEARATTQQLLAVRQEAIPAYLDRLQTSIPWDRYDVVGFTSTFQQTVAAVALARRIKALHPHILVIFGGANLEGEMGEELVQRIPEIDFAVDGEADAAFPELLDAVGRNVDPRQVPGVIARYDSGSRTTPARPPLEAMDDLPFPDFSEYFNRTEKLGLLEWARQHDLAIPLEGSRGCWWGAVQHCTFCGLNRDSMAYRSKSTERLLEELAVQASRHRIFHFQAADNIAPPNAHRELFPEIEKRGFDYRFFFEVKANMRREQVHQMKRAGVEWIQPGIESLSTHVLNLMHKGVRAIDNVNLLRWAMHYGIDVSWNILWGFPGETEADYMQQAELVPSLSHLQPPASLALIWLERFSPLYADRERFPARTIRAERSYRFVYPDGFDHDRAAYFFDFEFENTLPRSATLELESRVMEWKTSWREGPNPRLRYRSTPDLVEIEDARDADRPLTYHFEGALADLYIACSELPRRPGALTEDPSLSYSAEEIAGALDLFCEKGLTMRDGDRYLSLGLPATQNR